MANNSNSVCRICRVERMKLFLKGNRCLTDKCAVERRAYPPGEHGRSRRRILGYGIQLREKQKLKRYYGMSERQFLLFFKRAERKKGITGEILLNMLERRLDNVVFLIGFSLSRANARKMITHGHFWLNGRKVTAPSLLVEKEDVLTFNETSIKKEDFKALVESNRTKTIPGWLDVDFDNITARVVSLPTREDIAIPVEEHLVVELYSK
ncbi:MAG: 30S ribosomal protein S4 [Candidatus Aminicenantes bacterium]|nr:30S ribosomal protein S4 [Candidatus Aminicenantes bacterium]